MVTQVDGVVLKVDGMPVFIVQGIKYKSLSVALHTFKIVVRSHGKHFFGSVHHPLGMMRLSIVAWIV